MPCKIRWQGVFCPGYPIRRRQRTTAWTHTHAHTTSGPGCGRHMAAGPICTRQCYFTQDTTVADKHWWGFLHTHLPMFRGVSPQSNITAAASDYFYMHTIILFASHVPNHRRCNSCNILAYITWQITWNSIINNCTEHLSQAAVHHHNTALNTLLLNCK